MPIAAKVKSATGSRGTTSSSMEHISNMDENIPKDLACPAKSLNYTADRADELPDWPETISGITYAPFRSKQSPHTRIFPTREQIREDLLLIRALTRHIRTYSVEDTLSCIPEIAEELGMSVTLGVWINQDVKHNNQELMAGIDLTRRFSSVCRLIIGNEVLYRNDASVDQLIDYLRTARGDVTVPVSTSEIWHIWCETPELAEQTDFIAAHVLPFWEGISATDASAAVIARASELKHMFPDKPLILSEIGWPSNGNYRKRLDKYLAEQSIYLRTQLSLLEQHGHDYFVLEAFDQPWKTDEGLQGPHWGIFDAQRTLKLQVRGPIKRHVSWQSKIPKILEVLRPTSWVTGLLMLAVAYSVLVAIGMHYAQPLSEWVALPVALFWAASLMVGAGTEVHEFLEACWGPEKPRSFPPKRTQTDFSPRVSVHVPCYNEPPEMVKQTLDSLNALKYPDLEVLIIDNNTQDPETWKPIEQHCQQLGPRFRFFHVDSLEGFKAGALNYLLEYTSELTDIVAVIDADYCVHPLWLKHMVPHFENPDIAVIQVPQDYRDGDDSLFKRCCNAEYRGFFNIGMVVRNNQDAIIQHGTMTLIRKSALQQLGWAQWCICEDAELGLRMLEHGFSTGYNASSYGKGLIPDTFTHFKKQRYRWAYGAMQIVKQHAGSLIRGKSPHLHAIQRYHFLAGWMPWAAEGLNYLLTLTMLFWSVIMVLRPDISAPVAWVYPFSLLLLLALRVVKVLALYQRLISTDIKEALAAILAGMALYPTIGKAVLSGIFTSQLPFFRTPKQTSGNSFGQAMLEAREDVCMVLILWGTITFLFIRKEDIGMDLGFWIAMLFAQSLPYLAAVVMAILSAIANRPSRSTT